MGFHPALQLLLAPAEMLVRCDGNGVHDCYRKDEAGAFGCELEAFEEGGGDGHF